MIIQEKDYLEHYGTPRHSGRYPWGSGENPYQRSSSFLGQIDEIKKANPGIKDTEVARLLGLTTSEFRAKRSYANDELRAARYAEVWRLYDKGVSKSEIARRFGTNESTIRSILKEGMQQRATATKQTCDVLKEAVADKKYIDIGAGIEATMGISSTRLGTAVKRLKDEGYQVYNLKVDQLGTGYKTTIKVLCAPGVEFKEVAQNKDQIQMPIGKYSEDNGLTYLGIKPPTSVDPSRVSVVYKEDGGEERDGVILLRPGVADASLGESHYAQVRIKVGEDHYLKGMAMYGDPKDFPDGVDFVFNTNKSKDTPMLGDDKDNTVLKRLKDDPDNPFGATVKQKTYIDENGNEVLSPINIVGSLAKPNEEGNWGEWSKTISSQVLSKQNASLAEKQLTKAYKEKLDEYDEISSLTNPAVKKTLLKEFADSCDAAAAHLDAAGMPRQQWHVILPFPDVPEGQIYAPNYNDGENVILIRYPHAGRFEIPSLTVNNKIESCKESIGNAKDAVGINNSTAKILSGADFDGDTVLVIPNNNGAFKTSKPLKDLEGFDPQEYYPAYEGMPRVGKDTGFHKQQEMGSVSNLITDMTIKNAPPEDIAAAVRHSMVVIDAEKHNLNWRQSAIDNNIAGLKEKYQDGTNRGASTIVSKADATVYVPHRRMRVDYDPETGEKIYYESGDTYQKKNKKTQEYETKQRLTKVSKMSMVKDAYELVSNPKDPPKIEKAYADYANHMKTLANNARKEYLVTPNQKMNPSAKKTYAPEVESLMFKLNDALKNKPLERKAQALANVVVAEKRRANPEMDNESVTRLKSQALNAARAKTGASKHKVQVTPKEWEAIQAGAVSNNTLVKLLANTDTDLIRSYATPRSRSSLSASDLSRIRIMMNSGNYTQAQVASIIGVSASTINKVMNG